MNNKSLLLSMLTLSAVHAAATNVDATTEPTNAQLTQSVMTNQCIFWIGFLFPIMSMYFSYWIAADNEPNTAKDSILYAKFLTNKVERKIE